MTASALALVLLAAFFHATWNLLAKKAGGGVAFVWLGAAFASAIYAPVAIWVLRVQKPSLGWANLGFVALSAVVNSLYFCTLHYGYRIGDLSVVYPLARGTGPLLSAAFGVGLLGERLSLPSVFGIGLMALGVLAISGFRFRPDRSEGAFGNGGGTKALAVALSCGALIATYTVVDKVAVSRLGTPPLLQDWGASLGRFLILGPIALRQKAQIRHEWHLHRWHALGIGALCSLGYILVLSAMVVLPVAVVAPAREVSILIGTIMGTKLLREKGFGRRIAGAAFMVFGFAALALG